MAKLRTAIQLAMRAGKQLRTAADIVKEGRAAWAVGRSARSGMTAASIADDIARNAAMKPNLIRSGGGNMVPTGGSSIVGRGSGGALVRQPGGAMAQQGGGAIMQQGGALVRQPGGAMAQQGGGALMRQPGNALVQQGGNRFIPPIGLIPMFTNPPLMPPTVGPNDWDTVPDPPLVPREPLMPPTSGFTSAVPDLGPPPMIPRSPVPVTMPSMPEVPMTVPPNMELPDVMPLAPRTPTLPDMSMGPPDITMPGFESIFDDPDPTPGPMDLGVPEIDYSFLDAIGELPSPMGRHWRTPVHRTNFPTIARY